MEFSPRSGRELLNLAKKRTNIIPIIDDARHPHKYRLLVGKRRLLGNGVMIYYCNSVSAQLS